MNQSFYKRLGESVHRETLPNGLQICVVPKPGYAKKYAFFATRYGGMDTRFCLGGNWLDTPAGIAHYLEHKMFDTKEGNALQELAKNGAEPNAFTANAMTGYYFSSTEHFEENLEILLSFVSIPYFTEESVAKEQGIIGQEIRMIEDDPDWQLYARMMRALYSRSTAAVPIAGTVESISHITAETLYDCHRAFYTPTNMILTVVGDVDPVHIADLARRILPREGGPEIPRDYGQEPEAVAERETSLAMEVSAPQFLTAFKCRPPREGEDFFRTSLLGGMACDILLGDSSPLYLRLYDQGLIKARSVEQTEVFKAAQTFARVEGILPAPESSHAIKVAMDEAIKCKETGEAKNIVFGLTGTGYFDMVAYQRFNDGEMQDYIPSDEDLAKALGELPKVE